MAELLSTGPVPVSDIVIGTRLRPVSESAVESLMASIRELGVIKDEVHLRQVGGKSPRLELIAGGHRVEAARRLEMETVPAKVWRCAPDWARLMEIDDNLAHAELDALELATFLAERKAVHEKLHPEARRGGDRKSDVFQNQTAIMAVGSFARTVAQKRGMGERSVYRLLKIGQALNADQLRWLRAPQVSPSLADLEALSKEGDDHTRSQAIIRWSNGETKTLRDALKAGKSRAKTDPTDAAFQKLLAAWRRASPAARRRFLETEAETLVRDLTAGGLIP
jgi:ParB family chromosome partitioning protein